jgi:hypothetical protein
MKQMSVLKTEVEACVKLGVEAILNQLEENYAKKIGINAWVILIWLNNWRLNIPN